MTGVDSYSITPINNETIDANVTWKEGQLPSTVNNGMRQILTDVRNRFNDLPWFQYGNGDQDTTTHLAKPCVYASATSFTVTGTDQTAYYHANRPMRAVGSLTGTIYGYIVSSSYGGGQTTVIVAWNSGSLSNETLVISAGLPVLGFPGASSVTGFPGGAGIYRVVEMVISDPGGSALTTGDSKDYFRVPAVYNGFNLVAVAASLFTASSSGVVQIMCHRVRAGVSTDMLTTPLTIDANETDSSTAATPAVIDTANDDAATADQVHVDIDGAGTGAKGLNVQLIYRAA